MNRPGMRDTIAHSSVQAWSAGKLFPAVIAVIERYSKFDRVAGLLGDIYRERSVQALESTSYELTIGAFREEYATREDAEQVAAHVCQGGRIIPERYAELIRPGVVMDAVAFNDAGGA